MAYFFPDGEVGAKSVSTSCELQAQLSHLGNAPRGHCDNAYNSTGSLKFRNIFGWV